MPKFIVMSPCTEPLRYGPDSIKKQAIDAHTLGKLAKFVIGWRDLKDPSQPPTPDNFKFSANQIEDPDVVIFVDQDGKSIYLKGADLDHE
jgi:hypothetical protein